MRESFFILIADANVNIDFSGLEIKGPVWFVLPAFLVSFGFFIWSLMWIFGDAERRGKSGWLSVLFLLAAFWPWSLLWWLWLRPPPRLPFQLSGKSEV